MGMDRDINFGTHPLQSGDGLSRKVSPRILLSGNEPFATKLCMHFLESPPEIGGLLSSSRATSSCLLPDLAIPIEQLPVPRENN
ncbi:MAG: hypothetical protein Q8P67_08395 [archaeon]|nr:hypothetical protein [archaeon]